MTLIDGPIYENEKNLFQKVDYRSTVDNSITLLNFFKNSSRAGAHATFAVKNFEFMSVKDGTFENLNLGYTRKYEP